MEDNPRLWAAIRKAVEVKLLPSHASQNDYLAHIDMIRQMLAAADGASQDKEAPIKLHRDHPKEFALCLLDYTPTIAKRGNAMVITFDELEQAEDAYDLIWHAINAARIATPLPCQVDDDAPAAPTDATGAE